MIIRGADEIGDRERRREAAHIGNNESRRYVLPKRRTDVVEAVRPTFFRLTEKEETDIPADYGLLRADETGRIENAECTLWKVEPPAEEISEKESSCSFNYSWNLGILDVSVTKYQAESPSRRSTL